MTKLPPLSIYVHLPWCVAKCPYCDFNSYRLNGTLKAELYVDALIADLDAEHPPLTDREVISVFIGGGTPSLFPPEHIDRLLRAVEQCFRLLPDAEITMEANPGAVEHGSFAAYRQAGVNRLSLGAQSFDDARLAALGRIHGAADIGRAFDEAARAGFANINLDLMYGLPDQTEAGALADMRAALDMQPAHLSHYHLTLEPDTVFHRRPPRLPDDDETWSMLEACQALLQSAGYDRYEVSAYARPGQKCRHNLNYWEYGDYVGVGAGAHSKITNDRAEIWRFAKVSSPREYMHRARTPARCAERCPVPPDDRVFEFMLNASRLLSGFSRSSFEARTGIALQSVRSRLDDARGRGLLEETPGSGWRPTALGLRFLDDLQMSFLPPGPGFVAPH